MILNRVGAKFFYEGITYTIGDKVFANEESDYAGLYGTILEIYDGDDKETDNDTPDIVCSFLYPVAPEEVARIEERFSSLYGIPKCLYDLGLEQVIMAPEMLDVLTPATAYPLSLYQVREEWIFNGEGNEDFTVVSDAQLAKHRFLSLINDELLEGECAEWQDGCREEEFGPNSFSCWLTDEYCSNHYTVMIEPVSISITNDLIEAIGKHYVAGQFRKQFAEQIESWEEVAELAPNQMAELIGLPEVPDCIRKHLEGNSYLIESYWESVSEVAFSLVKSFIRELDEKNGGAGQ